MSRRREFIAQAGAAGLLGAIQRAQAVAPDRRSGTLQDVDHVVVLMQENRAFDHYFGSLGGVRGFADPFPLPTPGGGTVWTQPRAKGGPPLRPFRLDTRARPELMRLHGTPHTWPDAQAAWDHGRLSRWPVFKHDHAMAHYGLEDVAFHVALAEAFTLCDAYHCSFQGGTHPNRYYLNTGCIDAAALGGGPALFNDVEGFGPADGSGMTYRWTTYSERLQAAGVPWQVYQVLADNFGDNVLATFQPFRDAKFRRPGHLPALRERAATDAGLDRLRADVLARRLPAVSWIVGTGEGSEHPATSSPPQGASYIAKVLDALTANPEVWARTVLFINYDENDGWFDHMPPPAVPSLDDAGRPAGHSGVPTEGEYLEHLQPHRATVANAALLGRPLGLGPRVPMFVVSPWSRGGWVCSEVLDHTSVLRFMEARFGVAEPNITPWRRAVCGDLTRALDFSGRDATLPLSLLPDPEAAATSARALKGQIRPVPPREVPAPVQAAGQRRLRAQEQRAEALWRAGEGDTVRLTLRNAAQRAIVIHAMDRLRLQALPRRYTLAPGGQVEASWPLEPEGRYDLWLLAAAGWHRHATGEAGPGMPLDELDVDAAGGLVRWTVHNPSLAPRRFVVHDLAYGAAARTLDVPAGGRQTVELPLPAHRWYDWSLGCEGLAGWRRRAAGHAENGTDSVSDPAMHGEALLHSWRGGPTRRD